MSPELSLICPMYNEEENIDLLLSEVTTALESSQISYEIICVNDGSTDNSLKLLIDKKSDYPALRILNLSRNFGKEAALTAGLSAAVGDAAIPFANCLKSFVLL